MFYPIVVTWCKEQYKMETLKYKEEQQAKSVQITFHADRPLDYDQQKLLAEDRTWALNKNGFQRVSDDKTVDITKLSDTDQGLYYKDEPFTTKKLLQRLMITYSHLLEKKLDCNYTCETILQTLKELNFAEIQEQGFIPLYKRTKITDKLYDVCEFRTDYQFVWFTVYQTKNTMVCLLNKERAHHCVFRKNIIPCISIHKSFD